ncbi:hypothetical protein S7711_03168 [Stachybotrys chartarum IBT 7711]|uniref:Uncharacterized protein n=1 Tax=Stachybotrys chartarum (strain CBS 109288 / IBT 7711) TaxID=1280523 RepID=A0A084AWK3_STACB|nr:hypothetical protein S7711_03168 [Stachybotrys chartarum IBT 7711]
MNDHPLAGAVIDCSVQQQMEKLVADTFDWYIAYPDQADAGESIDCQVNGASRTARGTVYGCNLIARKEPAAYDTSMGVNHETPIYTFLATRIHDPEAMSTRAGLAASSGELSSLLLDSALENDTNSPQRAESTHVGDTSSLRGEPGSPPRAKLNIPRPTTIRRHVHPSKPTTVPTFSGLPGDAVARRLKEQRDTRLAESESQKASAKSPTKIPCAKSSKKQNFELPGDAISRRKKEAREAKLKAEEEEERKKREFKARPIRHTIGHGFVPRETIASLARQGKLSQDYNGDKRAQTIRAKRGKE